MNHATDDRRHEDRRLENRVREMELTMVTLAADVKICGIQQKQVESALDSRYRELGQGQKMLEAKIETLATVRDNLNGAWRLFLILVSAGAIGGVVALFRTFVTK